MWSEIPHLPKLDTKRKPREISRSADTQKPNIDFKFLIRHLAKLSRTPPPRVCRRALCFAIFPSLELVANDKSAMIYVNLGKATGTENRNSTSLFHVIFFRRSGTIREN